MTNKDKRLYIEAIEEALLKKTTPENLADMAESLEFCDRLRNAYNWRDNGFSPGPGAETAVEAPFYGITETTPDSQTEEEQIEGQVSIEESVTAEAATLTKDDVKKRLSALQNTQNVDVAAVLQSFGYRRLSEVPAEKYGELLAKAEAEVK